MKVFVFLFVAVVGLCAGAKLLRWCKRSVFFYEMIVFILVFMNFLNSVPLKRLPSARSSMKSIQRSIDRTRNRYQSGKILTESLENFQDVRDLLFFFWKNLKSNFWLRQRLNTLVPSLWEPHLKSLPSFLTRDQPICGFHPVNARKKILPAVYDRLLFDFWNILNNK